MWTKSMMKLPLLVLLLYLIPGKVWNFTALTAGTTWTATATNVPPEWVMPKVFIQSWSVPGSSSRKKGDYASQKINPVDVFWDRSDSSAVDGLRGQRSAR